MAKIAAAETVYPVHITPHLTCKKLQAMFDPKIAFIEIPAGIEGTSNFLRAVADRERCQALHDIVDREEKRVLPERDKIRRRFAKSRPRILLVSGPANEVSIGKIYAEFGAEVFIVPSMHNAFYKQEKTLLEQRYGVVFIERDFDLLGDLLDEIQPTVVACEFQAQVETAARLIPTIINMLYLCEYGYDFAIDIGAHFFDVLHQPVYDHWRRLKQSYGVGR